MSRVEGDWHVTGGLRVGSYATKIARSDLVQDALSVFPQDLLAGVIHDAPQTRLPGTSSGNDLAIVGTTFGTDAIAWETADLKAAGSTTNYARLSIRIPECWEDGETLKLRISAGMITTIADTEATVDVSAYKSNRDGAKTGSDLITTSASSDNMNSLTFADVDFTINATTLSPGDLIDVRVSVLVNDGATGTVVKGRVGAVELLADIKG